MEKKYSIFEIIYKNFVKCTMHNHQTKCMYIFNENAAKRMWKLSTHLVRQLIFSKSDSKLTHCNSLKFPLENYSLICYSKNSWFSYLCWKTAENAFDFLRKFFLLMNYSRCASYFHWNRSFTEWVASCFCLCNVMENGRFWMSFQVQTRVKYF